MTLYHRIFDHVLVRTDAERAHETALREASTWVTSAPALPASNDAAPV